MLKQRGALKEVKLINEKSRSEVRGKFLTQQGEYTDWYYIVRKNCILMRQIYGKSPMLYSCGFRNTCTIIDACSLPFRDGSLGVVIAVNDEQNEEYFLAYYSVKISRIVKKIIIRKKITKVVTVLDATKKNEIGCLHENLKNFPHLLTVGTYGGDCILLHFGIDLPTVTDSELQKPPFSSNLCKSYISDGRFNFVANNGAIYPVSVDELRVTAIHYLERCKTVVIGFSCGAFIIVNLLNGTDASYYYSSSPVYGFSYQEPMDDPRPVLYLWVAHSQGKLKSAHVILFVINFPNDEGHPSNEWTFNDLIIINYLTWYPEKCTEWLSFRTVVSALSKEHTAKNGTSERLTNEESYLRTNVIDTSRLLMTWKTTENTVEGALFDLNAFYYRRLPRQVTFVESFLKLNSFLSLFTLPATNDEEACLDYLVNYSGVWQHQSPYSETNDFFIFAPSYSFEIVTFNGSREFTIFVPSIQKVVLKWLDENFEDAIGQKSDLACAYLNAVGLAKTPLDILENSQLSTVPLENESVIISSLLFHGEINDTLKKHILTCPSYDTIHQIASLIWREVVNAKQKFDELSEPLFDRIPRTLSAANMCWLRNSASVFHCAAELFAEISKRVPSEKVAEATTLNYNMMASRNLVFYTNVVFLFHRGGLLPVKNYTAVNARMKAKVDKRKECLTPGTKLYIVNLLEEMQSACPNETFWCGLTADEWYPPNSIGTLLSATLAMKITETSKQKLIGYFLLDYDDLLGKEPKVFDRFKWRFPYRNQAICNQIEMNWRRDCGSEEPSAKCAKVGTANEKVEKPVRELEQLMKRLLLSKKEIEFIKESLLKTPNGIREWNRFCLRRKMFASLLPPEKPKHGVLVDRCDRWTIKILEDFPVIQTNETFPRVLPTLQNLDNVGKMMRDTPSQQCAAAHPYLSPAVRLYNKREVVATPQQLHDVVSKSVGIETAKASNFPISPVYDRRISNYERILPKENLENVYRLLQTPTPRHRSISGTRADVSFTSLPSNRFSPISLPASILKTRKERRHENTSADATDSQFKTLRFDLPNSFLSSCDSAASNASQMEEQTREDDLIERSYDNALDVPNPVAFELTDVNEEVLLKKHIEIQDKLKMLDRNEAESTDAANQESIYQISYEEQSDSDIVEDQERSDETHERIMERYFEHQGKHNDGKTGPSVMKNDNILIQESCVVPLTVSFEEQNDSDDSLDATDQERQRDIQYADSLRESTSVQSTTRISRHTTTFEVKISPVLPKKPSSCLIDEVVPESKSKIASAVNESEQKNISYEEEDESDLTFTEIENAIAHHPEMILTKACKTLDEKEDIKIYSTTPGLQKVITKQASSTDKAAEDELTEPVSPFRRRRRSKQRDVVNDRQAFGTFSSDSFQSTSSDSEVSTSLHQMLTRSVTKGAKLVSLSPEVKTSLMKGPEDGTSSPHIRETTPRRSTRVTSSGKSSAKTQKTRRKSSGSETSSIVSRETTTKRSTRAASTKGSPKTVKIWQRRPKSGTNSPTSRETTPKRSTRATLTRSSARTVKTGQKRPESRTNSPSSREPTPKRSIRGIPSTKSSPKTEKIRRTRSVSGTSSIGSCETTPKRSTRAKSTKSPSKTEKTVRKRSESGVISPSSRETTPKRSTRAIPSAKSSPKTEKIRRTRSVSGTSSIGSCETTPKRSTRAKSTKSPSKTEKTVRKRSESGVISPSSRETTPKRSIRGTFSSESSPGTGGKRKHFLEKTLTLPQSREITPEQSIQSTLLAENSPTRKSLRCSRTHSEQIEAVITKASPNPRKRAASVSETLVTSHPMLTRSARKAKSGSNSPPKQRTISGFEPTLTKIDEVPTKSRLRVGRKTVAQVLEEKMK